MSLKIADYLFYGPFLVEKVRIRGNQVPVVFAVVCRRGEPWNPTYRLMDIGYSGSDGLVLADHPDRRSWEDGNIGELEVYLYDAPASQGFDDNARAELVREIKEWLDPRAGLIPLSGG